MRRILLGCAVLLIGAGVSSAQDPNFSLSSGYFFQSVDLLHGGRAPFHGWYLVPEYHITKSWSAILEFTNFFGSPGGVHTNIQGYSAGVLYGFQNRTRLVPFAYTEVGAVYSNAGRDTTAAFLYVFGVGVGIKLTKFIGLQLIPGDYLLTVPGGVPLHNYGAQFGLVFNFRKL